MATEPHDRLRQARLRAGYETAKSAAKAFGWNPDTYKQHENGLRGLRPQVAIKYGRTLRVSPAWLLTGENPPSWLNSNTLRGGTTQTVTVMRTFPKVKLVDVAKPDFTIKTYRSQSGVQLVTVGLGEGISDDAFVCEIEDESNAPDFRPGEEIVVDPNAERTPGDFVLVRIEQFDRAVFGRYRPRGLDKAGVERFELKPMNEDYPTETIDGLNPGAVVGKIVRHIRIFN